MQTVGFGDITPITLLGRLFTAVFIISGVVLIGQLTTRLIQILSTQRAGAGPYVNTTRRILVLLTGETSLGQLQDMLSELFHPEHHGARQYLHAIILMDAEHYRPELRRYFHDHPVFTHTVTYLQGSVFAWADLVRACAHTPEMQAAFVLQRRFGKSDTHNLLRVLALRRHLPNLPIYTMLANSDNRQIVVAAGVPEDNILSTDQLRHGLLAANVITPGAAPLLINLFSVDVPLRTRHHHQQHVRLLDRGGIIRQKAGIAARSRRRPASADGGDGDGHPRRQTSRVDVLAPRSPTALQARFADDDAGALARAPSGHSKPSFFSRMWPFRRKGSLAADHEHHGDREHPCGEVGAERERRYQQVARSLPPILPAPAVAPSGGGSAQQTSNLGPPSQAASYRPRGEGITLPEASAVGGPRGFAERLLQVLEGTHKQERGARPPSAAPAAPPERGADGAPVGHPAPETEFETGPAPDSFTSGARPTEAAAAWEAEYGDGLGQEVYEVRCPDWLAGRSIMDAVVLVYCSRLIKDFAREEEERAFKEAAAAAQHTRQRVGGVSGVFRRRRSSGDVAAAAAAADTGAHSGESSGDAHAPSSPQPRFRSIEDLVGSLASRLDCSDDEGPVLVAVRHTSKSTGSEIIRCDLTTRHTLKHDDSLFIVARDISVIGHNIASTGIRLLKAGVPGMEGGVAGHTTGGLQIPTVASLGAEHAIMREEEQMRSAVESDRHVLERFASGMLQHVQRHGRGDDRRERYRTRTGTRSVVDAGGDGGGTGGGVSGGDAGVVRPATSTSASATAGGATADAAGRPSVGSGYDVGDIRSAVSAGPTLSTRQDTGAATAPDGNAAATTPSPVAIEVLPSPPGAGRPDDRPLPGLLAPTSSFADLRSATAAGFAPSGLTTSLSAAMISPPDTESARTATTGAVHSLASGRVAEAEHKGRGVVGSPVRGRSDDDDDDDDDDRRHGRDDDDDPPGQQQHGGRTHVPSPAGNHGEGSHTGNGTGSTSAGNTFGTGAGAGRRHAGSGHSVARSLPRSISFQDFAAMTDEQRRDAARTATTAATAPDDHEDALHGSSSGAERAGIGSQRPTVRLHSTTEPTAGIGSGAARDLQPQQQQSCVSKWPTQQQLRLLSHGTQRLTPEAAYAHAPSPSSPHQIDYSPPQDLRDHIVIITDGWLPSLHLFLYPLRQISSRPVVVLSPSPIDAWYKTVDILNSKRARPAYPIERRRKSQQREDVRMMEFERQQREERFDAESKEKEARREMKEEQGSRMPQPIEAASAAGTPGEAARSTVSSPPGAMPPGEALIPPSASAMQPSLALLPHRTPLVLLHADDAEADNAAGEVAHVPSPAPAHLLHVSTVPSSGPSPALGPEQPSSLQQHAHQHPAPASPPESTPSSSRSSTHSAGPGTGAGAGGARREGEGGEFESAQGGVQGSTPTPAPAHMRHVSDQHAGSGSGSDATMAIAAPTAGTVAGRPLLHPAAGTARSAIAEQQTAPASVAAGAPAPGGVGQPLHISMPQTTGEEHPEPTQIPRHVTGIDREDHHYPHQQQHQAQHAESSGIGGRGPLYFVHGNPLLAADLHRARIATARRCVVYTGLPPEGFGDSWDVSEYLAERAGDLPAGGAPSGFFSALEAGFEGNQDPMSGVLVDAVAVLVTMMVESRLGHRAPMLVYGTTTEIARNSSVQLLPAAEELRATGLDRGMMAPIAAPHRAAATGAEAFIGGGGGGAGPALASSVSRHRLALSSRRERGWAAAGVPSMIVGEEQHAGERGEAGRPAHAVAHAAATGVQRPPLSVVEQQQQALQRASSQRWASVRETVRRERQSRQARMAPRLEAAQAPSPSPRGQPPASAQVGRGLLARQPSAFGTGPATSAAGTARAERGRAGGMFRMETQTSSIGESIAQSTEEEEEGVEDEDEAVMQLAPDEGFDIADNDNTVADGDTAGNASSEGGPLPHRHQSSVVGPGGGAIGGGGGGRPAQLQSAISYQTMRGSAGAGLQASGATTAGGAAPIVTRTALRAQADNGLGTMTSPLPVSAVSRGPSTATDTGTSTGGGARAALPPYGQDRQQRLDQRRRDIDDDGQFQRRQSGAPPPPPPPPPRGLGEKPHNGGAGRPMGLRERHAAKHSSLRVSEPGLKWTSRYAAGRLFPTSCVNSLLIQSFYNPSLLRLISMFARGDQLRVRHVQVPPELLHSPDCPLHPSYPHLSGPAGDLERGGGYGYGHSSLHQGGGSGHHEHAHAYGQEAAGPAAASSEDGDGEDEEDGGASACECSVSYAQLFLHMVLRHRVTPLGLFRDRRWLGAPLPYVHSNPAMNAGVRYGDVVFVVVPVK